MIFRTILFLVFVESFYSVIYVSESGSDTTGCGTVGTPCKTLTYAFNSSTSLDVVMLPGFVAGPLRLTFSSGTSSIEGNTADSCYMNCTLTGQPMFYCSATGVLSLKNIIFCITVGSTGNSSIMQLPSGSPLISFDSCTFIPYSIVASNSYRSLSSNEKTVLSSSSYTPGFSSSQLSCYLFRVNSGSISFTSSFFSSFSFSSSLANYSIINFVAGKVSIELDSCTFSYLISNTYTSPVFRHQNTQNAQSIIISNTSFTHILLNCSSTSTSSYASAPLTLISYTLPATSALNISSSLFYNISDYIDNDNKCLNLYGIVIYIDKIFTPFSCESNIFTNISSYYYSNNVAGNEFAYGCIYINLSSSSSAVSLSSCTFMNCSVYSFSTPSSSFSAFCGGAAVSFYKNINFNFSSCFFSSCYSFHVGGAVFTNPTSALSNVYMRFDHCNFKNNHADYEGMYGGGYNIFILIDNNAGWNNFIESGDSNSNFIYNNSCSDNDAATSDDSAIVFYVVSNSSYIKGDLYFGFDACLLSIFYVSSRGSDESDCGNDDNSPCKTISYISDVSFGDIYIEVMESSNIKDFGVEISRGRTFTIVGETSAFISFFPASIDDSSTIYCFFVNFGTLAISFLTFNHSNADILSVTDSYFIVTSGELKLMDCYLKFIPSINPVLIKVLFTPFVISSSSNIILERVSMDLNYSSNSSVSIFNVSSGSFSSSGGSYKNIILNGSANCLFFGYDISSLNITNSSFSSIQRIISSSSSNYEALGGSVFSFGLNQKCTAYVGENSTFTNCSIVSLLLFNYVSNDEQSLVGGGCIYMTLFSSTSLTISNVSFSSCSTEYGNGGAIYLDITPINFVSPLGFSLDFSNIIWGTDTDGNDLKNSADNGVGNDLFIIGYFFSEFVTKDVFIGSFSLSNVDSMWGNELGDDGIGLTSLLAFLDTTLIDSYVSVISGSDVISDAGGNVVDSNCTQIQPCKTLSHAIFVLSASKLNFYMASGDYSGEIGGYILNDEKSRRFHGDSIWIDPFSLKYSKGHPSVYDNSDLQTSLSSDFSGCNDEFVLFYIKSGRMFFDSITFYHHHDGSLFIVEGHSTLNISLSSIKHLPSSESPSPVPFVILSSEGILAIYSCSISDINLSSNSLIWLITSTDSSHSPNLCVFSVLIDSSNFTSISSNNSSILSTNFLEDIINVSFTLSIVNSIFNSITIDSPSGSNADSWFGGLFFIKFSQFTPFSNIAVNSSVFKDIKIVEKNIVGGVFYIYDNPSVTVFMNTTGSNISISQSGGFMYIGNEESIVSNLSVSSSKFNLCSSEYNGGCLYIDATISFQLLNSSFTSCSSTSGYGGVLALNSTEYMSYSHILQYYFSQVNFSNNSAGNGGNDIIDFSELCLNRIVEHTLFNFSSCSSTSSSVKFFVYDEPNDFTYDLDCLFDGVDSCKIKPIPIPFNIYISSDGTDESHGGVGCGLVVSNPCKTFGGGFETLRNEKPFDAEAVVYINTAGESSYEVNNLVLTESLFVIIAKSISNKPTITANFNLEISQTIPDFVICAGYGAEVTVSYLKFIHAGIDSFNVGGTTISNNTKGVIFVLLHSSSVLSIDNCDFTQAEESTSSKIYMVNSPFVLKIMGDLSLSNCRFSDFCISASKNNNSLHSIIYSNNDFGNTQFDNVSVSNVVCCDYYAVFASLSLASSSLSVFNISNCEFEMINISNILPGLGAHSFRYGGIISFVGNSQSSFYFSNNGVEEIQIDSNDVIDISGGGLYVVGEIFNLLISDSFFEGINGGYNGGAVYINLSSSTSAKIENSIFSECVANNYGGAIFVDNVSVSLSSCSFLSNSALSENSLIRGSDVYHNNYSSGNNYYTSSTVSSCCSTSSSLQFLINCTSDDILTCSKDSLFSVCSSENTTLDYNEFIISSDGSDEFSESQTVFCNSAAPCKTINVVLNFRLDRSLSKTYIINITSSGVNQSSISISGGKKLKLYGGLNGISKIHLCFNESSDEGKSFISLSSSSSSLFDTLSLVYCFVDNGFYFITVSDDSKVEIDNCLITSLSFFSSSQKSLFKISSFFSFSGNSNCGCSVSNSNFSQMSLSFKQNHSFFSFQNLGNLSLISCIFDDISSDDFDSTTSSSILFVFSKPSSSLLSYLSFTDISYSININSVINKNFFPKLISLYSFDSTFNNVNITISSTSESITHKISNDENDYILLFFSNSSLNVTNSNFYGLRGLSFIPEINSISEVSTFTSWTNGFLTLVKSTSTLDSCIFNNIDFAVISVSGGISSSFINISFTNTSIPLKSENTSLYQHIHCDGGSTLDYTGNSSFSDDDCLWVDIKDCKLKNGGLEKMKSLYTIPSLKSAKLTSDDSFIVFSGSLLIPHYCVFEIYSFVLDSKVEGDLEELTVFDETSSLSSVMFSLSESVRSKMINESYKESGFDWRVRVKYPSNTNYTGVSGQYSLSSSRIISLQADPYYVSAGYAVIKQGSSESSGDINKDGGKNWIVFVIIGGVVVVVVISGVIFCIVRIYNKRKSGGGAFSRMKDDSDLFEEKTNVRSGNSLFSTIGEGNKYKSVSLNDDEFFGNSYEPSNNSVFSSIHKAPKY